MDGNTVIYGDATELLGIMPSPTSTLLKKLADMWVTEVASGFGKGKYRFGSIG